MSAATKIFPLGQVVAIPGALYALTLLEEQPLTYLSHHARGEWGEVCREDALANDQTLEGGRRLFSAYKLRDDTRLWIITEADRSSTCILLPEEY